MTKNIKMIEMTSKWHKNDTKMTLKLNTTTYELHWVNHAGVIAHSIVQRCHYCVHFRVTGRRLSFLRQIRLWNYENLWNYEIMKLWNNKFTIAAESGLPPINSCGCFFMQPSNMGAIFIWFRSICSLPMHSSSIFNHHHLDQVS